MSLLSCPLPRQARGTRSGMTSDLTRPERSGDRAKVAGTQSVSIFHFATCCSYPCQLPSGKIRRCHNPFPYLEFSQCLGFILRRIFDRTDHNVIAVVRIHLDEHPVSDLVTHQCFSKR